MIRMVVFDMAGTTVNEDNVVYKTLQKVINNAGYNFSLEQVLREGAGKEKLKAIEDIIQLDTSTNSTENAISIYANFRESLAIAYDSFKLLPQPGTEDLFNQLHQLNILVVLNTGYDSTTANGILEKLNWTIGITIDALITASDVGKNRPNPDMILLAMEKFGIQNSIEVVKVGDSIIDIEEGKNAGCSLTVGITTGAHTYEQLATANPNYIIHHLRELIAIIRN